VNAHSNETEIRRHALAISIWENEGGAHSLDSMDYHYGRRLEVDGSYHVFTYAGGYREHSMSDLSRSGAAEGMMSLNLRNAGWRRDLRNAGWLRDPGRLITRGPRRREIDEVWL
jgi:hypothetical protein